MPAKILIVEDEDALVELLSYNLEAAGLSGRRLRQTSDDAMLALKESQPDLVMLDWMLPASRASRSAAAQGALGDAHVCPDHHADGARRRGRPVRGLATGADDYVVKPFSVAELMARVKALLRRSAPEQDSRHPAKGGHHARPPGPSRDARARAKFALGPTEYRLLEFFMESAGRVLSRAQLLDGVWGRDAEVDERTVDVHVGRLRKSLDPRQRADPIRTVRGAGYVFDEKPTV